MQCHREDPITRLDCMVIAPANHEVGVEYNRTHEILVRLLLNSPTRLWDTSACLADITLGKLGGGRLVHLGGS